MIYDKIENASKYYGISKDIDEGLQLLANGNVYELPLGKKVLMIGDEDVFVNISSYDTKPEYAMRLEAHRAYIDIQCILCGEEKVALGQLAEMQNETDKKPENDVWNYEGPYKWHPLESGHFMMLFPHEPHGPSIQTGSVQTQVKKALIKVKI